MLLWCYNGQYMLRFGFILHFVSFYLMGCFWLNLKFYIMILWKMRKVLWLILILSLIFLIPLINLRISNEISNNAVILAWDYQKSCPIGRDRSTKI